MTREGRFAPAVWAAALLLLPVCAHALILGSCTASASSVNFGTYDPLASSGLTSTGLISVSCTLVTSASPVTIDLDKGVYGTYSARGMSNGTNTLSYNLYLDSAHSLIWGDTTGGTSHLNDKVTPGKPSLSATVYGLIPPAQDVSPGPYNDTITVTVSY